MSLMRKSTIAVLAGTFALAACDPNTGERTQAGGAVGALLGGFIGAAASDDNRIAGTVVGAAIGAVVGGAIGQTLDAQQADLEDGFQSDEIDIINTGEELIVRMPQDILFDFDSAVVRPQLRSDLNVLAGSLLRFPDSEVFVVGHTDNVGTASYNLDLSQRRADSVASILFAGGVSPARVVAFGEGESRPIATNLNADGQALNRRVDITIRPTQ